MISIKENKSKHIPGITSFFVSFDYKAEIVDAMKTLPIFNYDKKAKEWEIPITSLSEIIDKLYFIDDIEIILKKYELKEDKKYKISKQKTKLFKHQEEAVNFGLNHDSWLLLDVAGLGKTLSMIALASELKKKENIKHCLIICGINSLKSNWKNEIKLHSDLSCRILGERVSKKGKYSIKGIKERLEDLSSPIKEFFVITNIETLRDENIVKAIKKGKNDFDMVVLDECHTMKSPTSIQGKNLLKVKDAKYKIGLTGTLLLNNPMDAYMPLKWIGAERSSYTTFKYYYCQYGGAFNNVFVGFKNIDHLKYQLDKYSLRRTKDLLDLPEKTVIKEYIDMDKTQELFYNNIKDGVKDQVDKVNLTTGSLLAMVSRLRQATACPSILTSENIPSAKIDRAVNLTEEIITSGDKIVIFSTFKETVNVLKERLSQFNPLVCTGDTDDAVVEDSIRKFQTDDTYKVFIGTWQKMGTGHTLNAASYMCFIDTPWTYGVFSQAQDRIHRIGTKKPVFIYNLICKNTFDERVAEIVDDKQMISDYIIDDKVSPQLIDRLKDIIQDLE